MTDPIVNQAHKFQIEYMKKAADPRVKIAAFFGGLQSGKSVAGADATRDRLYGDSPVKLPKQSQGQMPEVWILSKIYDLAQTAFRTFQWRAGHAMFSDGECRQLGLKRGDKNSYWLKPSPGGDNKPILLRVRTAKDPEAMRATPSLLLAWCDEMAHWPELTWQNLQGRGIVAGTKYLVTTTPKGKNWLYRDVYIPGTSKAETLRDQEIQVTECRSIDNPWASKKWIASLRKKMGPQYAEQELDGMFRDDTGLVYSFDRQIHVEPLPSMNPMDYPIRIMGADPGYGDPYACGVWLRDIRKRWYLAEEFYKTHQTTTDIIPWAKSMFSKWKLQKAFVDKRRPTDVKDMRRAGIPAAPNLELFYENDRRTILPMIRVVESLFREDRLRITPDCEWHMDEFENYCFPSRDDKNSGENPVDFRNHGMDEARYALCSMEGHNYVGPGQLFAVGPKGEFGSKPKRLPPVKRTLGQSIAVVEKTMDEKEKQNGPRQF